MTKDSNQNKINITKEKNIAELVMEHPDAAEVLLDYGLHCVGCAANTFDSIEMGAKLHGLTDEDIDEIIIRVNDLINFGDEGLSEESNA